MKIEKRNKNDFEIYDVYEGKNKKPSIYYVLRSVKIAVKKLWINFISLFSILSTVAVFIYLFINNYNVILTIVAVFLSYYAFLYFFITLMVGFFHKSLKANYICLISTLLILETNNIIKEIEKNKENENNK